MQLKQQRKKHYIEWKIDINSEQKKQPAEKKPSESQFIHLSNIQCANWLQRERDTYKVGRKSINILTILCTQKQYIKQGTRGSRPEKIQQLGKDLIYLLSCKWMFFFRLAEPNKLYSHIKIEYWLFLIEIKSDSHRTIECVKKHCQSRIIYWTVSDEVIDLYCFLF